VSYRPSERDLYRGCTRTPAPPQYGHPSLNRRRSWRSGREGTGRAQKQCLFRLPDHRLPKLPIDPAVSGDVMPRGRNPNTFPNVCLFSIPKHVYPPPVSRCGPECCSCFVTGLTFRCYERELVKNFLVIEGDEWIRETARAAAAPDILHGLRTLAVSPKALHLSA
jgi:hypothetical protein